jgi:hypothetical protein
MGARFVTAMTRVALRIVRWVVLAALCAFSITGVYLLFSTPAAKREFDPLRLLMGAFVAVWPFAYLERTRDHERRMRAAFEALAIDAGGRISVDGLVDPDFDLTWARGGVRAHLNAWIEDISSSGKGGNPPASARYRFRYTLELPPQPAKLRLEVRPETVLEAVAKMFGMQDLSLGHPDLDRRLIVQASDQDEYARCLERGLGGALADLLRLSNETSIAHVSFVRGRLVVQRSRTLMRNDQLEVKAVREMHDVTLQLAAAITGLDVAVLLRGEAVGEVTVLPPVPEGAACLVCGGAIDLAPVVCKRCETPHHRDCWDYNGACALYACGSREARPAQRAAAAT